MQATQDGVVMCGAAIALAGQAAMAPRTDDPSATKIGIPEIIIAVAVKTSIEPRAIDATMSALVPKRNNSATMVIAQNVLPRLSDAVPRQFHKNPVVVSAKNTRYANVVMLVNRS